MDATTTLDQIPLAINAVNLNNQRITGVAQGTDASDAVNKG